MEARRLRRVLTIHATHGLTSDLVAPADRGEVGLVVHEAAVEEWLDIWALGADVDLATRSRVLEVLEPIGAHLVNEDVMKSRG